MALSLRRIRINLNPPSLKTLVEKRSRDKLKKSPPPTSPSPYKQEGSKLLGLNSDLQGIVFNALDTSAVLTLLGTCKKAENSTVLGNLIDNYNQSFEELTRLDPK